MPEFRPSDARRVVQKSFMYDYMWACYIITDAEVTVD